MMKAEMTIDDLEELRYLISEIKAVQQEIEGMYNTYRSPSFEKIGSSPQHAGDPTAEAVQKIMALQQKYNSMLTEMADRRDRVNSWLVGIDDQRSAASSGGTISTAKAGNRPAGLCMVRAAITMRGRN